MSNETTQHDNPKSIPPPPPTHQRPHKHNGGNIDPVEQALETITKANPKELAQYFRILVSSTSSRLQHDNNNGNNEEQLLSEISSLLIKDGMVTVTGKQLRDALKNALHHVNVPNLSTAKGYRNNMRNNNMNRNRPDNN